MELEYLLFIWVLFPWAKSLLYFVIRKVKRSDQELQLTKEKRTPLKNMLIGSSVLVFGSIPYFGAYYYADLKTLWLSLGAIYLVIGIIMLIMGLLAYLANKHYSEEIKEYESNSGEKNKSINSWPSWQTKILCAFQYIVLALWLYSWRHLVA